MIDIVLGRASRRRQQALRDLGRLDTDPFGRPHTLRLTDSHRSRTTWAETAVDRRTFEPPGRVLTDWFVDLHHRFGGPKTPATSRQLAALLAVACGREGRPRDLALVQASERARLQGVDVAFRPEHITELATLDAHLRTHPLARPSTLWRSLLPVFENPSNTVRRWLKSLPPIVVDAMPSPVSLLAELLVRILESADDQGVRVAVELTCPAWSAGDDLAWFFSAAEEDQRGRDFVVSRSWRRLIATRWIATGRAETHLAGPQQTLKLDVSLPIPDALCEANVPDGDIVVGLAETPESELRIALDAIAARLTAGCAATDIVLVLAQPERYSARLPSELRRRGLQADRSDGTSVAHHPVGQAFELAGRVQRRQDLSPLQWLALGRAMGLDPTVLFTAIAPAGITSGPPGTWRGRLRGLAKRTRVPAEPWMQVVASLEAIRGQLERSFTTASYPERAWEWLNALAALGWGAASPLEAAGVRRSVIQCATELHAVGDPGDDWILRLMEAAASTRLRTPSTHSLRVLGPLELRSVRAPYVYVIGLTRSGWPAHPAPSPVLTSRDRARIEPVHRQAEARHTLWQLHQMGSVDRARQVVLSCALEDGGRPQTLSPLVSERWPHRATRLPTAALDAQPASAPAVTGRIQPTSKSVLGVTSAETALQCPARFWYQSVLSLRPLDPWDPELEPRRRGTALHTIFQRFYEEGPFPEEDAPAELYRIGTEVLDLIEAEGGFEPALQAWSRGRWLAGLRDRRPAGLLAAWLLEERRHGRVPEVVESRFELPVGSVRLVGTIDRVDRLPDGSVIVVDYKTGTPPSRKKMEAGLSLQPLVYTAAAAPNAPAASVFQQIKRPDQIGWKGAFGDADIYKAIGCSQGVHRTADERADQLTEVGSRLSAVLAGDVSTTRWGEELGGCGYCDFRRVCRVQHDESPAC